MWFMGLIVFQYSDMLFEAKGMTENSVIHPNSCSHGDNGTSLWQHLGRRYENESLHLFNGNLFRDHMRLDCLTIDTKYTWKCWYFIPF